MTAAPSTPTLPAERPFALSPPPWSSSLSFVAAEVSDVVIW
ncbi:hypothetical protein ACFPRL_10525 [Pseudoclavibacter helvolus]